jgi:hypothetical protein
MLLSRDAKKILRPAGISLNRLDMKLLKFLREANSPRRQHSHWSDGDWEELDAHAR